MSSISLTSITPATATAATSAVISSGSSSPFSPRSSFPPGLWITGSCVGRFRDECGRYCVDLASYTPKVKLHGDDKFHEHFDYSHSSPTEKEAARDKALIFWLKLNKKYQLSDNDYRIQTKGREKDVVEMQVRAETKRWEMRIIQFSQIDLERVRAFRWVWHTDIYKKSFVYSPAQKMRLEQFILHHVGEEPIRFRNGNTLDFRRDNLQIIVDVPATIETEEAKVFTMSDDLQNTNPNLLVRTPRGPYKGNKNNKANMKGISDKKSQHCWRVLACDGSTKSFTYLEGDEQDKETKRQDAVKYKLWYNTLPN